MLMNKKNSYLNIFDKIRDSLILNKQLVIDISYFHYYWYNITIHNTMNYVNGN